MNVFCAPQLTMQVDDGDDAVDVLDALALGPFLAGVQPWSRTVRLHRVRPDASLLPPGASPTHGATARGRESRLVQGDSWTLRVVRWREGTADVTVSATTEALAGAILDQATEGAVEATEPEDPAATIGFWHLGRSPERRARTIAVAPWTSMRRNYTCRAASAFDRLMTLTPDVVTGRLLLLYGPPGTGKTRRCALSPTPGESGARSTTSWTPNACSPSRPT